MARTASPPGSWVTSERRSSTAGIASRVEVTRAAKRSRSTARALPAGTAAARAAAMISEPNASISRFSSPEACSGSSLRSELLHTSSARSPVLWAGVERRGRISQSTTGTPRRASW